MSAATLSVVASGTTVDNTLQRILGYHVDAKAQWLYIADNKTELAQQCGTANALCVGESHLERCEIAARECCDIEPNMRLCVFPLRGTFTDLTLVFSVPRQHRIGRDWYWRMRHKMRWRASLCFGLLEAMHIGSALNSVLLHAADTEHERRVRAWSSIAFCLLRVRLGCAKLVADLIVSFALLAGGCIGDDGNVLATDHALMLYDRSPSIFRDVVDAQCRVSVRIPLCFDLRSPQVHPAVSPFQNCRIVVETIRAIDEPVLSYSCYTVVRGRRAAYARLLTRYQRYHEAVFSNRHLRLTLPFTTLANCALLNVPQGEAVLDDVRWFRPANDTHRAMGGSRWQAIAPNWYCLWFSDRHRTAHDALSDVEWRAEDCVSALDRIPLQVCARITPVSECSNRNEIISVEVYWRSVAVERMDKSAFVHVEC